MLTANEFVLLWGVFTSVPILVKIHQEMRASECTQTDKRTNWFYNLIHAICYSYETDNNNRDDTYGAVIMPSHCERTPASFDECRLRARLPPTPDQANQLVHRKRQLPSASTIAIFLLLSPKAGTHFTVPRRMGWLSRSRHCSKGLN